MLHHHVGGGDSHLPHLRGMGGNLQISEGGLNMPFYIYILGTLGFIEGAAIISAAIAAIIYNLSHRDTGKQEINDSDDY